MISEQLYERAFEYKKTKLWKTLWDKQIFAVKLSDGRIGYITIMGLSGEYCALGLHIGDEGFQSLYATATIYPHELPEYQYREHMLQQDCLQCVFEGKDDLSKEEREEAKTYARAHKIRLSGKNAYPHFLKYQPNCVPWHLQTEQEEKDLCEALSAAIEMSRLLEEKSPFELGLYEMHEETKEIPLLELQDGEYVLRKIELPQIVSKGNPEPKPENDILIQKLKKVKKKGTWECGIIRFPEAYQNAPEEIPRFPIVLLAFDVAKKFLLPVPPFLDYEEKAEEFLDLFMDMLLNENVCPTKIKVRDERTYAFFKTFCECLHIKLALEEELPALEDLEYEFLESFSGNMDIEVEEMLGALQMLMEMDEEEREALPPELRQEFEMLMKQPGFLEDMQQILGELPVEMEGQVLDENVVSTQSYVISVSLGKGCYRHIQISNGSTLWELHAAIIDAFGFCDDHAHAFFMDNKKWSNWDAYYMRGVEDGGRTTDRYRLGQLGLDVGMQFKYVFDFGDEWTFQCKVLQILEKDTAVPQVIKSKGAAPEQYGTWWDE